MKDKLARALLDAAEALDPEVVRAHDKALRDSAVLAAVMATMDIAGISHCAHCPQRMGLAAGSDGRLFCMTHKSNGGS